MDLNDLLSKDQIDSREVLVFRHRPPERELRRVLPSFAAEKPDVFNAYQQSQAPRVEKAVARAKYVASFIGHKPGRALYVGLYSVNGWKSITRDEYWRIPANIEMKRFGMIGFSEDEQRSSCLWFDLRLTPFRASWKGKLVVEWPPPELAFWRWADRSQFYVSAVLEESALSSPMRDWKEVVFRHEQLGSLPARWEGALRQWRGVYYIFDTFDRKGYVGSAYGTENLFGRWMNYRASGHGGNKLLRKCNPRNLLFSILQRVSPDESKDEVIKLENTWKERLHTKSPSGLNDN